jgi:hypothetical protein
MSCKIIRKNKGFSTANQYKKSYVTKYKELITQVFCIALSFKSFLITKAI